MTKKELQLVYYLFSYYFISHSFINFPLFHFSLLFSFFNYYFKAEEKAAKNDPRYITKSTTVYNASGDIEIVYNTRVFSSNVIKDTRAGLGI